MVCKLCLNEKPLLKNSHIIPNFMYKDLFDYGHRLANVNLNDFSKVKYQQSGFKEGNILCYDCDNVVIGRLERYACNFLYTSNNTATKEYISGDSVNIPYQRYLKLDYTQLKLFFYPYFGNHIYHPILFLRKLI